MNHGVIARAIAFGMCMALMACCSSAASMFDGKTGMGMNGGPHGHKPPVIVAHRGASGMLPEHTLEAYREAILQGADFVECDAVLTKDGVLICRHEPDMSNTTNVAMIPEFASKRKTYEIDGKNVTGYFAVDFTLDEIKRLRAIQRLSFRDGSYDGQFQIPTVEEYLDLLLTGSWGREIGFYVETKRPRWHELRVGVEKKMEDELLEVLKRKGLVKSDGVWSGRGGFVESFDEASLKYLRGKTTVPLVQLLDEHWPDQLFDSHKSVGEALDEIGKYADAIGPDKVLIAPVNRTTNKLGAISNLVKEAHARHLQVHPWVFRNEYVFLPFDYGQDPFQEYGLFVEEVGVDGFFTDFPATAACYLELVYCSSGQDCGQGSTRSAMYQDSKCMFGTRKSAPASNLFFMPLHCLLLLSACAAVSGIVAAFLAPSFWRSTRYLHAAANESFFTVKNALLLTLPFSSYRAGWKRVDTVDDTPKSMPA